MEFQKIELTHKEILEIDFRAMGNFILSRTMTLSHAVNSELLEPISRWLDDPNFMDEHAITIESKAPNWSEYKKKQRQWTKQQKVLAAERLKLYQLEIQKKKTLRKDLKMIFDTDQDCKYPYAHLHIAAIEDQSIVSILEWFSPVEKQRRETQREFHQIKKSHVSNLLPWRLLIAEQIRDRTTLNSLPLFIQNNPKTDKISKFQHLLQMDKDGEVLLEQLDPESPIQITPTTDLIHESMIRIKDQAGQTYVFDWQNFNDDQKRKVITDAINKKILCKTP